MIYEYTTTLPVASGTCLEDYLQELKNNFPDFAQYDGKSLWFAQPESVLGAQVSAFNTTFNCATAKTNIDAVFDSTTEVVVKNVDPTISENRNDDIIWVNNVTGDAFICINKTIDANVWVGLKNGKLIRPIPPADKFDFFSDNSTILFSKLNKNANDVGGLHNGEVNKNIEWASVFDNHVASSRKNGTIKFEDLPIDATTQTVTISAWVRWTGKNSVMPFGWESNDIWCINGDIGFNTFRSDCYGFNFKPYKKKWCYMVIVFTKGAPGKIYVNAVPQTLSQKRGTFNAASEVFNKKFTVFGYNHGSGYRRFGDVGRLRMFNRELTPNEVQILTIAEVDMIKSLGGKI